MWKNLLICLSVGFASCAGTMSNSGESTNLIEGRWTILNVVENDSTFVRPSEIDPEMRAYIDFMADSTFGVNTNCNHLGGRYSVSGDSIQLVDILTTEMACDNMDLEEILKRVLPSVSTIDTINDSITRINTPESGAYIVLQRAVGESK